MTWLSLYRIEHIQGNSFSVASSPFMILLFVSPQAECIKLYKSSFTIIKTCTVVQLAIILCCCCLGGSCSGCRSSSGGGSHGRHCIKNIPDCGETDTEGRYSETTWRDILDTQKQRNWNKEKYLNILERETYRRTRNGGFMFVIHVSVEK